MWRLFILTGFNFILPQVFLLALDPPSSSEKILFTHKGFDKFSQGQLGEGGANLYITKEGSIRTIHQWDYNQDGNIDILVNNDHCHVDNSDLFIYLNQPGQGFTNIQPPYPDMTPLLHSYKRVWDAPKSVLRLPSLGGGRCLVQDLNRDGHPDIAFCNFVHGWHGRHFEAYIYWGSPKGYSPDNRTSLPTLTARDITSADLNGDGWPDLILANGGFEYSVGQTSDQDEESYVYWGGPQGYHVERRLSLPTKKATACRVSDLNGDGHPDLVFANNAKTEQSLYIYWGSSKGPTAENKQRLETKEPTLVFIQDLDRDGRPDLFVGHAKSNPAGIFYNHGGKFEYKALSIKWVTGVDAADLNGDGHVDLALAVETSYPEGKELTTATIPGMPAQGTLQLGEGSSYRSVSMVYWGGPDGFKDEKRTKLPTLGPQGVKIADLNDDKFPDLIFANRQDEKSFDVPSYIYWGSAEGYAPYHRTELQGFGTMSVEVVDANQDGTKDVLLVNRLSGKSKEPVDSLIYWGNPKGIFSPSFSMRLPTALPLGSASADLNFDGYPEIIFGNQAKNTYIYWGSDKGYLSSNRTELPVIGYIYNVADLNRDGYLDLVTNGLVDKTKFGIVIFLGGKDGFSADRRQLVELGKEFGHMDFVQLGDVDGDGYLDLLICGGSLAILKGGPKGFSAEKAVYLPGLSPIACQLADLNGDGRLDIFLCNYKENREGKVPSYIYWNSPDGFKPENRTSLETMGCGYASIADLNNDGALDIVTAHYNTGNQRSMPCYIYWGDKKGKFSTANRTELPGDSVNCVFIADLNRSGHKDVVLFNHTKDFDHACDSFIYWGSRDGLSVKNRQLLPTLGVHYSSTVDMGNIRNRKNEEMYISPSEKMDLERGMLVLRWKAECPLKSSLQFQVRFAESNDKLAQSDWIGPSGPDSYFTLSESRITPPAHAKWMQYRAIFRSEDGSNYPMLQEVTTVWVEK